MPCNGHLEQIIVNVRVCSPEYDTCCLEDLTFWRKYRLGFALRLTFPGLRSHQKRSPLGKIREHIQTGAGTSQSVANGDVAPHPPGMQGKWQSAYNTPIPKPQND